MKKIFFFLFICFLFSTYYSVSQTEKYSKVKIHITDENQISDIIKHGVLLDHYSKSEANSIDAELSSIDINILIGMNIRFDVLVDDVKKQYVNSLLNNANAKSSAPVCGLQNFEYGTMGHYHTYDEVIANLDSMASKYPDLITAKNYIGTSIEGRAIYAVKVSDNPYIDESSTEGVVYFDALHHAREPLSMESLVYYMWWLLENYATDPEATYLVNNRELHFIPIVNPDGYVYNQTTDPSGGGMWRKNRRNSGGGDFGVDLNRNYSSSFGDLTGSSNIPSNGTYHGDSAFSEPESRAVRDYVLAVNPAIAFSCHTSGQKFLISPGCFLPNEDYESYSEFSSEFINNTFYGYGTTYEMLNYSSCGTSRHFMHDNGIYTWVPELGTSFWPPQSEFCSTIQNFQGALKYISHVSGSYTRLNDFSVGGSGWVLANDTLYINVRVKNRGLIFAADSVRIMAEPQNANCTSLDSVEMITSLNNRDFSTVMLKYLVSPGVNTLDTIPFKITIKEKNYITHEEFKIVTVGQTNILFADDSETGMANWFTSDWDTTFIAMQSAWHSISDSRYGGYASNDTRIIELLNPVDLIGTTNPMILFNAKWSLDFDDFVYLEISTNGTNWTKLKTYSAHQYWQQQKIDLSNYIGQVIYLRIKLESDNTVQSDGFYFDDFRIIDFFSPVVSINEYGDLNDVTIYPNPASGFIHINRMANSKIDIELFHCTGKQVHRSTTYNQRISIDISNYAPGIYFIRIFNEGLSMNRKIVIY